LVYKVYLGGLDNVIEMHIFRGMDDVEL